MTKLAILMAAVAAVGLTACEKRTEVVKPSDTVVVPVPAPAPTPPVVVTPPAPEPAPAPAPADPAASEPKK